VSAGDKDYEQFEFIPDGENSGSVENGHNIEPNKNTSSLKCLFKPFTNKNYIHRCH
jgi:hypothetical protein